jgi:hypothetical protein
MKNLKTIIIAGILAIGGIQANAQSSYGTIKGQIINNEGEPVFGATIKITQGGALIGGTQTDENGKYTYKPLNPGLYEVVAFGMEFSTQRITNVAIKPEKTAYVDMKVSLNTIGGDVIISAIYTPPIMDQSMITGKEISAEQFKVMPKNGTDILGVLTNIASDVSQDANGDMHVRGGRAESTALIVDGVRTPNLTGITMLAVDNLSIITGGLPAQYGDAVNGVVIVTTRDYFSGIRTKHIAENNHTEKLARIKREKQAKLDEEKRKKEIEEEIRIENEAKAKQL